jgi:hypothetical protein
MGYKRLQFNVIVHKVNIFGPMKNLRAMLFPIFWVDEVRLRNLLLLLLLLLVLLLLNNKNNNNINNNNNNFELNKLQHYHW